MTLDRRAFVAHALSLAGLCACQAHREEYARRVLPPPPRGGWDPLLRVPFRRWHDETGKLRTTGISTCALSLYRLWEPFIELPKSWSEPYAGGAFVREPALARARGAWRDLDDLQRGALPQLGDAVWTAEHVSTCLEVVEPYSLIEVVEGGQECPGGAGHDGRGLQAFLRHAKPWPIAGLVGWIDVGAM